MQMLFTRLGRKHKDRGALPEGVSAMDLAIGQLLGLAQSAGYTFDPADRRLVKISANADGRLWTALKTLLDDIGVDAIVAYFERTTPERRKAHSAIA